MSAFPSPAIARLERRRRLRLLALLGSLAVVLVTSALLWPRPATGGLAVPTVPTAVRATGVLTGTMTVTRSGSRVCVGVAGANGAAFLRFPAGWSADGGLGVRDPSGLVHAASGDRVQVTGAPGRVGTLSPCTGSARLWTVTDLRIARAS